MQVKKYLILKKYLVIDNTLKKCYRFGTTFQEENMDRGPLYNTADYTPSFSGHQTFPLRYGWLKKVYDQVIDKKGENVKSIFTEDSAIATFGVGKNMVQSMRFWAERTQILQQDNHVLSLSKCAEIMFNEKTGDPWMENLSSVWIIHWNLVSCPDTTTFFYIFNNHIRPDFDKDSMCKKIIELVEHRDWKIPSMATIKKDVDCFLQLYCPRNDSRSQEEQLLSLLSELHLITMGADGKYYLVRGQKNGLTIEVFCYALSQFWHKYAPNNNTLSIETLTNEPGSPGRVFLLFEEDVAQYMYQVNTVIPHIEFSESAGLRQLSKPNDLQLSEDLSINILKQIYRTPSL